MDIGIIVLAAGSSSRMGRSKQLLEIDGQPLLCRCVNHALEAKAKHVVVVLGSNEKTHRDVIEKLPVQIVSNFYWKTGMGGSIKTGLSYLLQSGAQPDAVMLMVCDQPALTASHLLKLIQKFKENKKAIIASRYANAAGVPVLFGRSFFSNLLLLGDEHGAKKIIQQFPDQVATVDFPDGSFDLDTEEDYQKYINQK